MTYHQTFDRLGRPVARRTAPGWGQRLVRWASAIAIFVGLAVLAWGR